MAIPVRIPEAKIILKNGGKSWILALVKKGASPLLALGVSIESNAAGSQFCFLV